MRERRRHEMPLPRPDQVITTVNEFVTSGDVDDRGNRRPMPKHQSGGAGLNRLGWQDWPHQVKQLGEGFFGTVQLVYWFQDVNLHLEKRRFCALKVQKLLDRNVDNVWIEIAVLRGVKHEHIIDYYGSFIVAPETGHIFQKEKASGLHATTSTGAGPSVADKSKLRLEPSKPDNWMRAAKAESVKEQPSDEVWILMEFADAGDLHTEILRYQRRCIPEPGSRFYMKQICSGLRYLHDKGIVHNDLHYHNVLLKYNRDGRTKSCLICDFGLAEIKRVKDFATDVKDAVEILFHMLTGVPRHPPDHVPVMSPDASSLLTSILATDRTAVVTVKQLMRHNWFRMEAVPPEPQVTAPAPVMDYVNPDPPERRLGASARWPATGRGRRNLSPPHSPPPLPSISEEETLSRTRSGSGRGRVPKSTTPSPAAEAAAAPGHPASGGSTTSSQQSFGGWFRDKLQRKKESGNKRK